MEKISGYNLAEVDEKQKDVILGLLDFLNDWLIHHILENDKLIG
jgi:hemerythrin